MTDKLTEAKPIIQHALAEDIGDGDVTTDCIIPPEATLTGRIVAKAAGVVAGLDVVRLTFRLLDERIRFDTNLADGDAVAPGQVIATVKGPGRALLSGERVALNFFQRMSGIATLTRRFVQAGARDAGGDPGYPQNRARPAPFGQVGGAVGWRPESPVRSVRYGADQRQSYCRRRQH